MGETIDAFDGGFIAEVVKGLHGDDRVNGIGAEFEPEVFVEIGCVEDATIAKR